MRPERAINRNMAETAQIKEGGGGGVAGGSNTEGGDVYDLLDQGRFLQRGHGRDNESREEVGSSPCTTLLSWHFYLRQS